MILIGINQVLSLGLLGYPFGANNDLPDIINKVQTNYIAPGILKKKTQLIWGMGPTYKGKDCNYSEGNKRVRNIRGSRDRRLLESWDHNIPT
jgi:hypothetical protein